jgi:S1-C subfamily serine protease
MKAIRKTAFVSLIISLIAASHLPLMAGHVESQRDKWQHCRGVAKKRCVLVEIRKCNSARSIFKALDEPENYCGTGVIIEKDLVLTTAHLLRPDSQTLVDGRAARIIKKSKKFDLALLTVETENLPRIEIAERTKRGQQVFCVGNPGKSRNAVIWGEVVQMDDQFIYTDAFQNIELAMGASGSGLYSSTGCLIGLQKGMLPGEQEHPALSVSIPGEIIRAFLMEGGLSKNLLKSRGSGRHEIQTGLSAESPSME